MRDLLYACLDASIGTVISCDDPAAVIQRLSRERRESNDPILETIQISQSRTNPDGEVWLINKAAVERGLAKQKAASSAEET